MLDLFSTDQQNLQSPLNGQVARAPAPSATEALRRAIGNICDLLSPIKML